MPQKILTAPLETFPKITYLATVFSKRLMPPIMSLPYQALSISTIAQEEMEENVLAH